VDIERSPERVLPDHRLGRDAALDAAVAALPPAPAPPPFRSLTAGMTETRLRELTIDEQPVMTVKRQGRSVFAGCRIFDTALMDREVRGRDGGRRFGDLFYMIHTMRSGRHHPDGALWVRNGRHRVVGDKVSLTDVAPTVLKHFGVPQPERMRGRPLAT